MFLAVGRETTIVLVTFAVAAQLLNLWIIQRLRPHMTHPLWVALWTKKLIVVLTVLSGGLSLVVTRLETPLSILFIASLGAWLVASFWFWGVCLRSRG